MKRLPSILACFFPVLLFAQNKPTYKEPYRPQFHFTPHHNWMNDPNGLVFHNGEYHLFYQYNPMGNTWGHMSWGHAVSTNLVNWKHLPLAIPEDDKNMIFSGSCVIDKNNTSGFAEKPGQVPMVAIYTAHKPDGSLQNQHLAYSVDNGRTWKKYAGNPVLDLNKKDFRDPKVFWHAPTKKWVMVVMLPFEHVAKFYGSPDLKTWSHLSDFGPAGDVRGVWECPDLLQVPIVGQPGKSKWVLLTSQESSMQYFVGEFDGTRFNNENPTDTILRPDYGPDFYAGISYNNLPAGQDPVLVAWASNPGYAQATPTSPWRSANSVPRSLRLKKAGNTWTLLQQPVKALQTLRGPVTELKNKQVTSEVVFPAKSQVIELDAELLPAQNANCGIRLAVGGGQSLIVGYDVATEKLYLDRSNSGNTSFDNRFAATKYVSARVPLQEGKLRLHILFDKSIVEVYANDGATVITAQVFPDNSHNGIEFFSEKGSTRIVSAKAWPLKTSWK